MKKCIREATGHVSGHVVWLLPQSCCRGWPGEFLETRRGSTSGTFGFHLTVEPAWKRTQLVVGLFDIDVWEGFLWNHCDV